MKVVLLAFIGVRDNIGPGTENVELGKNNFA
jgi:hypothetical protein